MRHLRFLRLLCATALAAAAVSIAAAPAGAGLLSCGAASKPFAQFGDYSSYFLVPNGGFESGSTGWTLSGGASVVSGNEPFGASGGGSHALYLSAQSSALGPKTCVNLLTPHARMFVARKGTTASPLSVQVIFYGLLGNTLGIVNYDSMSPKQIGAWAPSDTVASALALPILTSYCRMKISTGTGGDGDLVDGVFEDPWINGMG